jgi:hypothetical protein
MAAKLLASRSSTCRRAPVQWNRYRNPENGPRTVIAVGPVYSNSTVAVIRNGFARPACSLGVATALLLDWMFLPQLHILIVRHLQGVLQVMSSHCGGLCNAF